MQLINAFLKLPTEKYRNPASKITQFRSYDLFSGVPIGRGVDVPKLNEEEAFNLEGMVTLNEAGKTLKNMKNNKSPGTSGFSADFYKVFWRQLGTFVVRAINSGFQEGELSVTQQHGLTVCIPKESKCRNYLNQRTNGPVNAHLRSAAYTNKHV